MAISEEQVRHVAFLARLALSDDQVSRLTGELSGILEHIEQIQELDLADVEPSAHALDAVNVMRPDEVRPGLDRDDALLNAPESEDGFFGIPKIV